MSAFPSQAARKQAQNMTRFPPTRPYEALARLPQVQCTEAHMKLATRIAQSWPRTDIIADWNAVARSPLNATEKQLMFNELWG